MSVFFSARSISDGSGYFLPTLDMMKNMSMHMGEYFYFSTSVKNFMFEGLTLHGSAGVVAVCLVIFSFTVLLEATKSLIFYLNLRQQQNPLTYGRTETSIQTERSPLLSALMIPSNVSEIRRKRIKFHIGGYVLHTLNLLLGYLLMLAIMSYDAYIFIAVICGDWAGFTAHAIVTKAVISAIAQFWSGLFCVWCCQCKKPSQV